MIVSVYKKAHNYFQKLNLFRFILHAVSIKFFYSILCSLLLNIILQQPNKLPEDPNIYLDFFLFVFAAPLIETFLFQFLPLEIFGRLKFKKINSILISGLLFGSIHYFNDFKISDLIIISISGMFYSFLYFAAKNKTIHPYLIIASIHASYNFIAFLLRATFNVY